MAPDPRTIRRGPEGAPVGLAGRQISEKPLVRQQAANADLGALAPALEPYGVLNEDGNVIMWHSSHGMTGVNTELRLTTAPDGSKKFEVFSDYKFGSPNEYSSLSDNEGLTPSGKPGKVLIAKDGITMLIRDSDTYTPRDLLLINPDGSLVFYTLPDFFIEILASGGLSDQSSLSKSSEAPSVEE